ncbi:uncharacterized protein [Ptychodera flava]|uniref:uncharacterized protein isoform X2 n=1 Tax=Ptychodera flava TaxID=63121 RepID=UPI003969BDBC
MLLFLPFLFMGCTSLISMLWIMVLPFYAAFCGPEAVLRLSILMGVHSVLSSLIPAAVISAVPLAQLGLVCLLLALPVNLSPNIIVWLFDKAIWISEPLLLTMEAIQVVRYTMYKSNALVAKLEDEPSLVKLIILGLAGTSYAMSVFICIVLRSEEFPVSKWLIVTLWLISFVILTAGIASEAGNILDVSVITLAMFCILWAMHQELKISKHPIETPKDWYSDNFDKKSVVHLFYSMIFTSLEQATNVSKAAVFLYKLMSLSFLVVVIVRVSSILHAVSLIPRWNDETASQY